MRSWTTNDVMIIVNFVTGQSFPCKIYGHCEWIQDLKELDLQ